MLDRKITEFINAGYSLVTPTQRLARHIAYRYATMQLGQQIQSWGTPDILPWNAWLLSLWENCVVTNSVDLQLLSPEQQLLIWQEIIRNSRFGGKVLQTQNTAKQVLQAWQLCHQWQLPIFPQNEFLNQDAFAFKLWADDYRQRCETSNWIDEIRLPVVLVDYLHGDQVPANIALLGFDNLFPQQKTFLDRLSSAGSNIVIVPLPQKNQSITGRGYADIHSEVLAAASWARDIVESSAHDTIGIIVPDLHSSYRQVRNGFLEVFQPDQGCSNDDSTPLAFSIALGEPLINYPLIDTAFTILRLGQPHWSLDDIGKLLRSPFISGVDTERQQRARFDAGLRKYCENKFDWKTIESLVNAGLFTENEIPEIFTGCCSAIHKYRDKLSGRLSCGQWVTRITEILKLFGWPGARNLDSSEYQLFTEWQSLLQKLDQLGRISGKINFREACSLIQQLARNQQFQPESAETPVQILGINGVAGMAFDHLWVIGLQEETWPPRATPNPFIPLKLQRKAGIPDASVDLKFQHTQQVSKQLTDSAANVVLSYPCLDGDRELRPSPLLKPYMEKVVSGDEGTYQSFTETIFQSGSLENLDDTFVAEIPAGETVRGGAGMFRDMAACPFRAFARHRLHAEGLDSRETGLDARDRGLIVHTLMEKLWEQLGDYQSLVQKTDEELSALIQNVVNATLADYQQRLPQAFTPRYLALEQQRLQSLGKSWLELERQRQPFTVIACEQWHQFRFNDIVVNIRLDRLDQLSDGRFVVIDYKTGDAKIPAWFDERPDEPQLPLYAVNTEGEIAAIVFARLRRGELAFIGLSDQENMLPGVTTLDALRGNSKTFENWQSLFQYWHANLQHLAGDFRAGNALVDPKNNNTCKYCDLHALCRITELDAGTMAVDGENDN